ncbi:peptidoglycan DD-metalloendopeptidase family protein [Marinimicrobium sp. ABcell2]|uniref:peptidoglycan DD-metalloendopeptidase family protein n=1 Tax=Marinimicrobium sp. ABcell2 TaxID=3069751 RepID=UPI0027B64C47|nr:peptidoglycan DD-metalloendopeptidase family protein [Marinimicrobium sp. ABcell2]MDQ2075410.1 peptidoglycan DD-metalloendopeptidase family protein [Marinimicrobium sp. ABcell2]
MLIGSDRLLRRLCCLIVISITGVFGASCSAPQPAAVTDRDQPPSRRLQTHRVSSGETLFSIAWRHGIDYRQLAHHNNISEPFTIYPGQTLRLDVSASGAASAPASATAQAPSRTTAASPPATSSAPPRSENRTASRATSSPPALVSGSPDWHWPAKGRIISAFGASTGLNQGIDIDGELGEPVIAAASGQVVYAGSGLRGYGNLLIIKHNDTYLSAYAHNDRLLKSEGDNVKAGEQVAEMGSSGVNKVKLHFEIRREGRPVDPIRYLPKR